ncbi:MAG TPA: HTH domain-containing protein [Clostridiaceae bacterium]|nr:HTH domain-containing protein [Clostridiaceae bacterium]
MAQQAKVSRNTIWHAIKKLQATGYLIQSVTADCSTSRTSFLQIPPHDGHPCLLLILPTARRIEDFHLLVIKHIGRTLKVLI